MQEPEGGEIEVRVGNWSIIHPTYIFHYWILKSLELCDLHFNII